MSPGEKPPFHAFDDPKWHCYVRSPGWGFRLTFYLPHSTLSCLFPFHPISLFFSTSTFLLFPYPHPTLILLFAGGVARPSSCTLYDRCNGKGTAVKQLPQADRHIVQWPEPDGNASGGCHTMWCIISMVLFCQFVTGGEPSMIIRGVLPRHRHLRS